MNIPAASKGQAFTATAAAVGVQAADVCGALTIDNAGVKIPIHYIMRKSETRWMVYDINIEGVSPVRNYQEQFKSILRKDRYEGLVKVLEEKINSFSSEIN